MNTVFDYFKSRGYFPSKNFWNCYLCKNCKHLFNDELMKHTICVIDRNPTYYNMCNKFERK